MDDRVEKRTVCNIGGNKAHLISAIHYNTHRIYIRRILTHAEYEWSRARRRYERQGLLVESNALEQAEQECLADSEARARRRKREEERRVELYLRYVEQFALRVRELFPACPAGWERIIAEHACLKYSGRIGRSAAGKSLDEKAVRLAVIAHVRHTETRYDELLASGYERWEARDQVEKAVLQVLTKWEGAFNSEA